MNKLQEAKKRMRELFQKSVLTDEEEFELTEVLEYLFQQTKSPKYYADLGGYYYERRIFNLALKYYTLADEFGMKSINLCLGYIWYYGRTGERDYKKAFECFSKVIELPIGNDEDHGQIENPEEKIEAWMKIADMYKNGYYVEKNYEKYKNIIMEQFENTTDSGPFSIYSELALRIARIYEESHDVDAENMALALYFSAREHLVNRLSYRMFFGDLNQLNWTVNDIYRIIEFNEFDFDLYDLFYLLKEEHEVSFEYNEERHTIRSVKDGDQMSIQFDDNWYHTITDFFMKATLDNESIVQNDYLYEDWKIIK